MKYLYTNFEYPAEIQDVMKLFFETELCDESAADVKLVETKADGYLYTATANGQTETQSCGGAENALQEVRLRKRYAKLAIYRLLVRLTGKTMPWGSLTGIRPTKLARQLEREGLDWQRTFTDLLGVSREKMLLTAEILYVQREYIEQTPAANLYVGIPFCVSRCSYCSFTSGEIAKLKKYVRPYVDALKEDITLTIEFAEKRGIKINDVYFGGGTPTSLTAEQLDEVMSCINFAPREYTVEAGRPDTVDEEKLEVLSRRGVGRISVNPQTFNQSVLDAVGRKHTVKDIYDKYYLAKRYRFIVNMDLIAGLPTESYEAFCHSVDEAVALDPDNITVHTLALKHGSVLKEQNYASDADVGKMVDYARETLAKAGYVPYYMYRQKYMAQNLENVGYCKPNKPCLYNIGIMEETSDILACGTNAISKRIISAENRIERAANAKDVITYIERNADYLQKKFKLFS